jgi:hypothetical protein
MALLDGKLTDKEKSVLFKKAEADGVDLDEFEMVLEAKLFEKQESASKNSTIKPTKSSNKFGDLKKCPSCGAPVSPGQTKCDVCGHEFSGIQANANIQRLFKMLDEVESERKDEETDPFKAFGSMMAKSFNLGVSDKTNNRKKGIIKNFPIPTTKTDILEFLSLAIPNARKQGNFFTSGSFNSPANDRNRLHNEFVPTWKAKCEQIIMKAKFSMKDDKETLDQINSFAKDLDL